MTFRGTLQQEGGLIHLHPTRFTADWFGIELQNHIGAKPEDGMCVEKNEIFLDPPRMLKTRLRVKRANGPARSYATGRSCKRLDCRRR